MPTRISTGVDYHPCFLTFYIPIDYKITNFSLHLFVFYEKSPNYYFLARA